MAKTAKKSESNVKSLNERVIEDKGVRTTISDHVVAKIAGVALHQVEGVHDLVPFGTGQRIEQMAKDIQGSEMRDLGVHVEVGEIECAIDTRIIVEYGVSIPKIAQELRDKVSAQVEKMTGLKVAELTIEVVDLYFSEDDREEPVATEEPRVR